MTFHFSLDLVIRKTVVRVSDLMVRDLERHMSSTSDQAVDYRLVPLGDEDAWDQDDIRVHAMLEKPVPQRFPVRADQDYPQRDAFAARQVVEALWTTAQVAARSLALGTYVASAARKWRRKRVELPEGTRLTLTLRPAKQDDRRKTARIVINDIHTKTPDEIMSEIRQELMSYARGVRSC